jgi:pseudouridine-5'-phosphate glycosidase/sugar/nucleoside kinase (ribokinase family)
MAKNEWQQGQSSVSRTFITATSTCNQQPQLGLLLQNNNHNFHIRPEVAHALQHNQPVVALESTIVAHGMPFPQNYEVALEVEEILRNLNVVPATIAIHKGVPRIGLSATELYALAREGPAALKCSTRDLPFVVNNGNYDVEWGATTVASTMVLAHLAGIRTFVTGGTGGVHREGHNSLDISADLFQLSQTPVVVVSAGIKSILDIRRTLEVLETYSVPVVSFDSNNEEETNNSNGHDFPAFFSPHSGVPTPRRVESPTEVSQMYWSARDLQLSSGMLVAVPNPHPGDGELVEQAIQQALNEAAEQGSATPISGRDVTPFILKKVAETTGGKSLESNIALVKNNAKVGAEIAIAIAKDHEKRQQQRLQHHAQDKTTQTTLATSTISTSQDLVLESEAQFMNHPTHTGSPPFSSRGHGHVQTLDSSSSSPIIVVMGGAVMDLMASPKPGCALIPKTSNPGQCVESDGGVGRNIAEVMGRLQLQSQRQERQSQRQKHDNHKDNGENININNNDCYDKGVLFYSAVGDQDDFGHGMLRRLEDDYGVMTQLHVNAHDETASSSSNTNNNHQSTAGTSTSSSSTVQVVNAARTATYLALLDGHGELFAAIADMDVLQHVPSPPLEVLSHSNVKCLVVDSNPPLQELVTAVTRAASQSQTTQTESTQTQTMVLWEPTSVPKAEAAIKYGAGFIEHVSIMTPNADELLAMAAAVSTSSRSTEEECILSLPGEDTNNPNDDSNKDDNINNNNRLLKERSDALADAASLILPHMRRVYVNATDEHTSGSDEAAHIVVTLGEDGVLHCSYHIVPQPQQQDQQQAQEEEEEEEEDLFTMTVTHYPVPRRVKVENCTGAGDTLTGALVHALVVKEMSFPSAIQFGMDMAIQSLASADRTIGLDLDLDFTPMTPPPTPNA